MDQKQIKIFGAIIGGFVLLILIIFLISSCTKKKPWTYEKLEKEMVTITKTYYKNHEKELPSEDKDYKTYTIKKMIENGDLEDLNELFKKEVNCTGYVTVENNDGHYLYTPSLSCGKEYQTKLLKDKVIEDKLTESGFGLYQVNNEYFFKGETVENYIAYKDKIFRIIRINENGTIRALAADSLISMVWDNRVNIDTNAKDGKNTYLMENGIKSKAKEALDNYYEDEEVWPDELKAYITTQTVCTAPRDKNETNLTREIECQTTLDNQPLSLLAVYEYLSASLESGCSYTKDKMCGNYNWLKSFVESWSITPSNETTFEAYRFDYSVDVTSCNDISNLQPVIELTDKLIYEGGSGTKEDPYTFR